MQEEIAALQLDATAANDRLEGLQKDVTATEAQRAKLQGMLATLTDTIAQRAQELADLENRIDGAISADTPEPAGNTPSQEPPQNGETDTGMSFRSQAEETPPVDDADGSETEEKTPRTLALKTRIETDGAPTDNSENDEADGASNSKEEEESATEQN